MQSSQCSKSIMQYSFCMPCATGAMNHNQLGWVSNTYTRKLVGPAPDKTYKFNGRTFTCRNFARFPNSSLSIRLFHVARNSIYPCKLSVARTSLMRLAVFVYCLLHRIRCANANACAAAILLVHLSSFRCISALFSIIRHRIRIHHFFDWHWENMRSNFIDLPNILKRAENTDKPLDLLSTIFV